MTLAREEAVWKWVLARAGKAPFFFKASHLIPEAGMTGHEVGQALRAISGVARRGVVVEKWCNGGKQYTWVARRA